MIRFQVDDAAIIMSGKDIDAPLTIPAFTIENSLTDNLDEHPFAPASVEFAVEDLLPGAEVKPASGYGNYNFTAHDLAFHVSIGIVFPAVVVSILVDRLVRGELFEPRGVVAMESALVVVDEHRSSDMHCVNKNQPLLNAALTKAFFYLACDVNEGHTGLGIEPQLLPVAFQAFPPRKISLVQLFIKNVPMPS